MELLSTAKAAQFIGVPEATLRTWRHTGRAGQHPSPRSFRAGKRVLYIREDLEAWVRACAEAEAKERRQVVSR